MGLFGTKDWNVLAIIFEKKDMYRVNGQRAKGSGATKARDGAKSHARTIYWAVFDQKRKFLEGQAGAGQNMVDPQIVARLQKEFMTNLTVQTVLGILERGEMAMAAKPLGWTGYPKVEHNYEEE